MHALLNVQCAASGGMFSGGMFSGGMFFHMLSVCQKRYDIMRSDGSMWEFHIPSS
jgi:hypothetical protein